MLEWTASVMIAIDPVITPAASFSPIRSEFERIETPAARVLPGPWAAVRHFAQQPGQVLLVGRRFSGVTRRPDPRRPAERGRLDAGVVGHGRAARGPRRGARLDQRVVREGGAGLGGSCTSAGSGSSS